jgi:hypothetical protein
MAQNRNSVKAFSSDKGSCTLAWEATSDATSHCSEIEEVTRSIIERVTERVAAERPKDQQDERRVVEIDRQLGEANEAIWNVNEQRI